MTNQHKQNDNPPLIRRARPEEQSTIRQMVLEARLKPSGLHWPHFVVAEWDGQIVGIGQIRPYPDYRELGSLFVRPNLRGQGIGGMLVEALLEDESGPVYLGCADRMAPYYQRFGFEKIGWQAAPMPLRFKAGLAKLVGWLFGWGGTVMKIEKGTAL